MGQDAEGGGGVVSASEYKDITAASVHIHVPTHMKIYRQE